MVLKNMLLYFQILNTEFIFCWKMQFEEKVTLNFFVLTTITRIINCAILQIYGILGLSITSFWMFQCNPHQNNASLKTRV